MKMLPSASTFSPNKLLFFLESPPLSLYEPLLDESPAESSDALGWLHLPSLLSFLAEMGEPLLLSAPMSIDIILSLARSLITFFKLLSFLLSTRSIFM